MKNNRSIGIMISSCAVLVALMLGAGSTRSQGISHTYTFTSANTANVNLAPANPAIFYIKVGGLKGPAKGYFKKSIEYPGFNTAVNLPDRLKAGTYDVQFVDASGRAFPGMAHASVTITSKPLDGATSGKPMHQPIEIKKELNAAAPMLFTIAPEDVDEDGMLNVAMTIKQGAPANANAVPTQKN